MQSYKLTNLCDPTWKHICVVKMSLSFSNRPLVVYVYTENVILSIKFITRCFTSSAGSERSIAFSNTTLNACWEGCQS